MAAHLSDTQVQGVVPPLGIHLLCEQPVGLHHHKRVGCLHGEEEIVVIVVTADVRKLKRALHLRTPGHPYFPLQGTSQEKVPRSSLFNCYQPAGKSRCLHACCNASADITAQETPNQSHTPPRTTQARVGAWVVDQVQFQIQNAEHSRACTPCRGGCRRSRRGCALRGSHGWCRCASRAPAACTSPPVA